jgi:hypothetical protein
MDITEVSDRLEIAELLARYATAVDRTDWVLYRSLFRDDATIDYTSAGGEAGNLDEIIDFLERSMALFSETQHFISNFVIDIDGDTAHATAAVFNPMRFNDDDGFSCGGYYHHDLVRTPDGWRSVRLVEEATWFDGFPKPQP